LLDQVDFLETLQTGGYLSGKFGLVEGVLGTDLHTGNLLVVPGQLVPVLNTDFLLALEQLDFLASVLGTGEPLLGPFGFHAAALDTEMLLIELARLDFLGTAPETALGSVGVFGVLDLMIEIETANFGFGKQDLLPVEFETDFAGLGLVERSRTVSVVPAGKMVVVRAVGTVL